MHKIPLLIVIRGGVCECVLTPDPETAAQAIDLKLIDYDEDDAQAGPFPFDPYETEEID